jgi:competence protein ComEC
LLWLCGPLARLLLWVNDAFAAPRAASIGLASPGLWGSALFFAALFGALRFRRFRRAACVLAALGSLFLPGPLHALAHLRSHELEVTFLSVGQGDATVLRLPDGSAILVDAGGEAHGRYDPGARDVLPYLRDVGIRRLEAAFVTHPHPDHLLGLPAIAAGMPIDHLYASGRRGDELARSAWARLPPLTPIQAGFTIERAGVRIEALGPPPGFDGFGENDASVVLLVEHGDVRFLLAGDVEAEGEAALLEHAERLRADVVKVPHHGSRTSSSPPFVAATGARFAVLCVGRANRFGFPHPEVVDRWREAGAETFRTDLGAVRFVSDGHRVLRTEAEESLSVSAIFAAAGPPDLRPHSN